jgi:hypothetical protein
LSADVCPHGTLGTGETESDDRSCAIRNLIAEGRPVEEIEQVYIFKRHLLEVSLPGEDQGIHIASIRETNRASAARMSPSLAGATLPHRERQILQGSRMIVEAPAMRGIAPVWALAKLIDAPETGVLRSVERLKGRSFAALVPIAGDPGVRMTASGRAVADALAAEWRA